MKAIEVKKLSKYFRKTSDLSSNIITMSKEFFKTAEKTRVLDEVSFSVERGESFGIVGLNGSGKSTLLKILAGIISPTKGEVSITGKIVSVIELGAGFNIELTGYENLLLQSALYGVFGKDLEKRVSSIVAFAELEDHIHRPTKLYSSGMLARLAFSIAVHMEPEVLLIDEVLSVGDFNFQRRCIQKIRDMQETGRVTLVLVSHDHEVLKQICSRVLVLEQGSAVYCGNAQQGVEIYVSAKKH